MTALLKEEITNESCLVNMITRAFNTLAAQTDLSPTNPKVNECLSHFVADIIAAETQDYDQAAVLGDEAVKAIRPQLVRLLSRAEFEMEMYFSKLLGESQALSLPDLNRFWYRDNYDALIRQEINGLDQHEQGIAIRNDDRAIIFVGAGPLPLSPIDYYLQLGKKCVCVEIDEEAAKHGQALIDKLGLSDVIQYIAKPGQEIDYGSYSYAMVAALVTDKDQVLAQIHQTAPDITVGIRSADGLKTLLYNAIDVKEVELHGFSYYGTALADNSTVNSTCFFRNKLRGPAIA